MKRFSAAGYAMGLVLLLAGCSQAPPPAPPDTRVADEKAIRDGEVAWSSDWATKDLDKILSHYADDGTLMVPDMPMMKGKDAIKPGLTGLLMDKNVSLSFVTSTAEVAKGGDLAYTQGTYSMTRTDPKTKKVVTEKGKYVTVYKKQADGSWKAIEDIVNEDEPAK
jgi:uncharacterized protein (TIGR02246 family)